MPRVEEIAALFIRLQALREQAWRAHIARKHEEAAHTAEELSIIADDLQVALRAIAFPHA